MVFLGVIGECVSEWGPEVWRGWGCVCGGGGGGG